MSVTDVTPCFTRPDGSYLCARWARPIVPVVFGIDDQSLPVVKGAIEALAALVGHTVSETDPELGANVMIFFLKEWQDLVQAPALEGLIQGIGPLVVRLEAQNAHQYRQFRFDKDGAIKAVFCFLRMSDALAQMAAEDLALDQAVRIMLTWADGAFSAFPTLIETQDGMVLNPQIASILRAAYAPAMPVVANDPSHALRIAARMAVQ